MENACSILLPYVTLTQENAQHELISSFPGRLTVFSLTTEKCDDSVFDCLLVCNNTGIAPVLVSFGFHHEQRNIRGPQLRIQLWEISTLILYSELLRLFYFDVYQVNYLCRFPKD